MIVKLNQTEPKPLLYKTPAERERARARVRKLLARHAKIIKSAITFCR